jgi:uncharacterized protein
MSDSPLQIPDFEPFKIDTEQPLVKWGWLRALIFVVAFVALIIPISFFYNKLPIKQWIPDTILANAVSYIVPLASLVLAIYVCRKFIDKQSFRSIGITFKLNEFLFGSLFGIVLMAVGSGIIGLAGWGSYAYQGFDGPGLLKYLLMFLLVAIFEEWMVRTYLLHSLMASMNKYLALLLTSVLFSLLHAGNESFDLMAFTEITLAGIMLGLWYIHVGNIWFPVGVHLTWNYFQGPIFGHEVSGNPIKESLLVQTDLAEPFYSGGKFGVEGSIVGLVLTVLACLWLEWYLRRNSEKLASH